MLMRITLEAEKIIAMDDFMAWYWKTRFTKFRVEIDLLESLKLMISIQGQEGIFW